MDRAGVCRTDLVPKIQARERKELEFYPEPCHPSRYRARNQGKPSCFSLSALRTRHWMAHTGTRSPDRHYSVRLVMAISWYYFDTHWRISYQPAL